jgi:hypothetical protein
MTRKFRIGRDRYEIEREGPRCFWIYCLGEGEDRRLISHQETYTAALRKMERHAAGFADHWF